MFGDKLKAFAQKKYGADKHLAAALGMSPQQLAAYTAEKRKPGFEILQKLAGIGCDISWILDDSKTIDELNDSLTFVKSEPEINGILDLAGAIELSNTPAARMAQLLGVTPATFAAWQCGTATPTPDQLAALFNQVVALALSSRHAATTPEAENPPTQATA